MNTAETDTVSDTTSVVEETVKKPRNATTPKKVVAKKPRKAASPKKAVAKKTRKAASPKKAVKKALSKEDREKKLERDAARQERQASREKAQNRVRNEFYKKLAHFREAAGLSKNEFCRSLGISRNNFIKLETKGSNPKLEMVYMCASALKVAASELI